MLPNLKQYQYYMSGKWPQRYKIFNLNLNVNKELKTHLKKDGFFTFFTLNKGYLVSYHQIIAFYKCGGIDGVKRGLQAPSTLYEVHHLDGNTSNNDYSNLVVIPKVLHHELTKSQRRLNKYLKVFSKQSGAYLLSSLPICFNTQGRIIKNIKLWIVSLLRKTLVKSFYNFAPQNVSLSFSSLKSWLKKTFRSLSMNCPIGTHLSLLLPLS